MQHGANRKSKKFEKERNDIQADYQQLRKETDKIIKDNNSKMEKMKHIYDKQSETERVIFRKEIE